MHKHSFHRIVSALAFGVALTGIWFGCADESAPLGVTQGCSLSSECKSPLVCAFAKCHQACKSSRDCASGERCVQSDRPYYVCQKQGCSRNSDCLGKQLCAQDGQCHDECLTQKDCLADQVCTTGVCADSTELVNGTLPNKTDAGSGEGQRCTLPTDCPGDLVCLRGGVCGAECIGDKDCLKTYSCRPLHDGGPGRCFPPQEGEGDAGADSGSDATTIDDGGASGDAATDGSDGAGPPVPGSVLSLAAGDGHECALLVGGKIKCWGYNVQGQLGLGDTANRGDAPAEMGDNLPYVDLGTGRTAKAISAGAYTTCAILDNDRVKCWGYNSEGNLGIGDLEGRGDAPAEMGDNLPYVDLGTGRTAKAIATGRGHTCAILDNNRIKCWGSNSRGQLGLGDTANRGPKAGDMGDNLPYVDLGAGRSAKALALNDQSSCAILDNDRVKCWGWNVFSELGLGDNATRGNVPNQMGDNLPYVDLGAGRTVKGIYDGRAQHVCVLLDNTRVKCWGFNLEGTLGLGDTVTRGGSPTQMGDSLPYVELGTGRTAKSIDLGSIRTCAILDNDKVKCWGSNGDGQSGLGDTTTRGSGPNQMGDNLPYVELGTGRTAKLVRGGYRHACAVLDNDKVKCWGFNDAGQLGLGDNANRGDAPGEMGDNLPYVKLVGP